jgi:hypothetical protein
MLITFDSSNAFILFFGKDEVYQTLQIVYKLCGQTTNRLSLTDKPKMAFFVPMTVKPSIMSVVIHESMAGYEHFHISILN